MKNIQDLRDALLTNFNSAKSGETPIAVAKELTKSANGIIATVKAQIEYNKYIGSTDKIPFMCVEPHEKE